MRSFSFLLIRSKYNFSCCSDCFPEKNTPIISEETSTMSQTVLRHQSL